MTRNGLGLDAVEEGADEGVVAGVGGGRQRPLAGALAEVRLNEPPNSFHLGEGGERRTWNPGGARIQSCQLSSRKWT